MDHDVELAVFEADDETRATFRRAMAEHLGAYHRWATPGDFQELMVSLTSRSGQLIGGLLGLTHGEWLYIEFVWVDESARLRGNGRRLLQAAEREAITRGCGRVDLDTATSGAEGFFRRCGYRVCGEIRDYIPGRHRYWLEKRLAEDDIGETGHRR
jgi:ribosomal protein S18 acetylase RimI-like enzyme